MVHSVHLVAASSRVATVHCGVRIGSKFGMGIRQFEVFRRHAHVRAEQAINKQATAASSCVGACDLTLVITHW